MKPNKENPKDKNKPVAPTAPVEPMWQPTWKWHLKVLGGVYVVLAIAYFAVSTFLSRVPPPYKLRDIPKEITPWMKK
jgi:hypothetical protein